jgi:hypothetical protein
MNSLEGRGDTSQIALAKQMMENQRQQDIKDKIAELQKTHAGWTFAQAWNYLQQKEPRLFLSVDELEQEGSKTLKASASVYRYVEKPKSARLSDAAYEKILQQYGTVRVEA